MTHPFEVTGEIALDATPEEVWDAIATGPGIDAWFMGHNEVGPARAAATAMTMGGHTERATDHRVGAERPPRLHRRGGPTAPSTPSST